MSKQRRTIRIAGQEEDPRDCTTGVAIFGDPGVGKSVMCQIITGDLIARGDPLVVLDVSGEELNAMEWRAAKEEGYPVHPLDPVMEDSVDVDWPKLAATETERWYLAGKIFPDIKGDQTPYFNLLAREIFFVALCVVCWFKGRWGLADALRLALDTPLLGYLADMIPHLGDPVKRLGDTKSAHDVLSTTRMRLSPLKPVAALLMKAETKIDLLNFRGALVPVGRDRDQPVWSVLYSLLFDLLFTDRLERPRKDLLGVILDECRQVECLSSLSSVMRRGRKCGIIPVFTCHSVEGWYDRYGELAGEEILSLVGRVIALKTGGDRTSRWLSTRMGGPETIIDIAGVGDERERRELRDRPNVTADEIRRLPRRPDAKKDRLVGFCDGPDDTFPFAMPWLKDVTPPEGWKPRVRTRRPPEDQVLPNFTARDFERLKFPQTPELMEFIR